MSPTFSPENPVVFSELYESTRQELADTIGRKKRWSDAEMMVAWNFANRNFAVRTGCIPVVETFTTDANESNYELSSVYFISRVQRKESDTNWITLRRKQPWRTSFIYAPATVPWIWWPLRDFYPEGDVSPVPVMQVVLKPTPDNEYDMAVTGHAVPTDATNEDSESDIPPDLAYEPMDLAVALLIVKTEEWPEMMRRLVRYEETVNRVAGALGTGVR